MFGQLIHRLATSSRSPEAEEEGIVAREDVPEDGIEPEDLLSHKDSVRQDSVRQWRVVSRDGVSSLLDLDASPSDESVPEAADPLESHPTENRCGGAAMRRIADALSLDTAISAPGQCLANDRLEASPNIGMPSALPRTTEILQAAASSRPTETDEPLEPKAPRVVEHSVLPDPSDASPEETPPPETLPATDGQSDAISREFVADAAASCPIRFRRASPLSLLKTPTAGREIDANLAKIITQWPDLTWPVQAAVLAMIDAASHESRAHES